MKEITQYNQYNDVERLRDKSPNLQNINDSNDSQMNQNAQLKRLSIHFLEYNANQFSIYFNMSQTASTYKRETTYESMDIKK